MSGDRRKQVGKAGEDEAAQYLLKKGWEILDRNWSSRLGELDIIARNREQVVFVEVRTTSGARFGFGFQSVDIRKQQKVRRLALQYLQQKRLEHVPVRFDVVSVLLDRNRVPVQMDHIEAAF
ncbi:YraN family protein [Paenactinomyces guangxiensis]|uniref:UPF0102 protein H1191_10360 n=1 Tax=Paenactinomyces guangxiensis TaxID=1490290 RepID=A0A7W1WRM3_9BACL|nr:YraN family protein [Paenactinomyces guangxiensis]MBA4494707.1 YraN family protein [Paenactinomyces guangxiensis]MBH8591791.1 YraN family protein [Paenactinomyces guangxiensis]